MKKVSKLLLILTLILAMSTPVAFANGGTPSGKIDSVLITMEDGTKVSIAIGEYIDIYFTRKGTLFNFLAGQKGRMTVHGVVSGDKYIVIGDYIDAYMYNSKTALSASNPIPTNEVSTFKKVGSINESTGKVELVPVGEIFEEFRVIDIY